MTERTEHCFFAILNCHNRCKADCHRVDNTTGTDCTGKTGQSLDREFGMEEPVSLHVPIEVVSDKVALKARTLSINDANLKAYKDRMNAMYGLA